jgi:hypothetical protein
MISQFNMDSKNKKIHILDEICSLFDAVYRFPSALEPDNIVYPNSFLIFLSALSFVIFLIFRNQFLFSIIIKQRLVFVLTSSLFIKYHKVFYVNFLNGGLIRLLLELGNDQFSSWKLNVKLLILNG